MQINFGHFDHLQEQDGVVVALQYAETIQAINVLSQQLRVQQQLGHGELFWRAVAEAVRSSWEWKESSDSDMLPNYLESIATFCDKLGKQISIKISVDKPN